MEDQYPGDSPRSQECENVLLFLENKKLCTCLFREIGVEPSVLGRYLLLTCLYSKEILTEPIQKLSEDDGGMHSGETGVQPDNRSSKWLGKTSVSGSIGKLQYCG